MVRFLQFPYLLPTLGTATNDNDSNSNSASNTPTFVDGTNGLLQTMVSLPPIQPNTNKAKGLSPTDLASKWQCKTKIDGNLKSSLAD